MKITHTVSVAAACSSGAAVIIFSTSPDWLKVVFTFAMTFISICSIGAGTVTQKNQDSAFPVGPVKPA